MKAIDEDAIPGYRIEGVIGRGGMGTVYRATDLALGRPVALKLLAAELATDPEFRARFVIESRIAASIDHPNVVPIYEAGLADGRLFIAMRFVDGSDLETLIRDHGPMAPGEAIGLLAGIAAALDVAHARGLIHRDVKPGNILVMGGATGHPYLADFGLTKSSGVSGFTASGAVVGSADFMAPEQGEGKPIDGRADVYSLAGVLFAALSGRPPFVRDSDVSTVYAHVHAPRPSIGDVRPELAFLDPVLRRGLAVDPDERFSTASELVSSAAAALTNRSAVDGEPDVARDGRSRAMPATRGVPLQLSRLLGRSDELAAAGSLLDRSRLVTIAGRGGIGKTRFALELVRMRQPDYADGAALVDLAPALDRQTAIGAIQQVVGVAASDRSDMEALLAWLKRKQFLLVLDNLEQLLGAASLCADLLAQSERLTILATSRVPLRARGERVFDLPPLDVGTDQPDEAVGAPGPAVELFIERARDAGASIGIDSRTMGAIRDVCARLEGLPLAIELAAARARAFPPATMVGLLGRSISIVAGGSDDRPERHRTLAATIGWSVDLLAADHQRVFRRFAPFVGGISLRAAEFVLSELDPAYVAEALATLVEQGLLRPVETDDDEPRFAMLETIREFAIDDATRSGELEAARTAHLRYFVELVEAALPSLRGRQAAAALDYIEREHDNLRAALRWLDDSGRDDELMVAVGTFARFWRLHGHVTEGRFWMDRALSKAPNGDRRARARALRNVAGMLMDLGSLDASDAAILEAVRLFEEIDDEAGLADALMALGNTRLGSRDLQGGRIALERSVEMATRIGDDPIRLSALGNLALLDLHSDRLRDAIDSTERVYQEARAVGDPFTFAMAAGNLAYLKLLVGDAEGAHGPALAAVEALRRLDDRMDLGWALGILATVSLRRGHLREAIDLTGEGLEVTASAEGVWNMVGLFEAWAEIEVRTGHPDTAAACLGAADKVRRELRYNAPPPEQKALDELIEETRAAIEPATFDQGWNEGSAMQVGEVHDLIRTRAIALADVRDDPAVAG